MATTSRGARMREDLERLRKKLTELPTRQPERFSRKDVIHALGRSGKDAPEGSGGPAHRSGGFDGGRTGGHGGNAGSHAGGHSAGNGFQCFGKVGGDARGNAGGDPRGRA